MKWTWLKTKPTNRTDLHLQWLGKRIFPVATIWEVTVTQCFKQYSPELPSTHGDHMEMLRAQQRGPT